MKKIWIFVLVGFLLIVTAVGVGGKMYMDIKKEDKNKSSQNIKEKQEKLALYIVQNYQDVKEIQFTNSYEIEGTGTWHISAIVNENNKLKFSIEENRSASTPRFGYNPDDFQLIEKDKPDDSDLSSVRVIYLEDSNND